MTERFLEGRVALVTGGLAGIGLAIAEEYLRRGAKVAIGSRSGPSGEAIVSAPGVFAARLDVTDTASVENFMAATEDTHGPIDILVNNAGTGIQMPIIGHEESHWLHVIDTNLNGAFRMTRAAMPGMVKRKWGRIINIASTAASNGHVDSAAYCASKSGLLGLTRVTALEGAEYGVTCIAISPTWVETKLMHRSMTQLARDEGKGRTKEDLLEETRQANPQNRIVQVEEIAAMAGFLCREEAKGITMEDIQVSAGAFW